MWYYYYYLTLSDTVLLLHAYIFVILSYLCSLELLLLWAQISYYMWNAPFFSLLLKENEAILSFGLCINYWIICPASSYAFTTIGRVDPVWLRFALVHLVCSSTFLLICILVTLSSDGNSLFSIDVFVHRNGCQASHPQEWRVLRVNAKIDLPCQKSWSLRSGNQLHHGIISL